MDRVYDEGEIQVISKDEFERCISEGYETINDFTKIELNAYIHPRIGREYRQMLIEHGPWTSEQTSNRTPEPEVPEVKSLTHERPTPFDMGEVTMDPLEEDAEPKEMVNKPLIQAVLEGAPIFLYKKAQSMFDNLKVATINNNLDGLRSSLYQATNLANSKESRQYFWQQAEEKLGSISSKVNSLKNNPKAYQAVDSLKKRVFDREDSAANRLHKFMAKNKTSFTKSDRDCFSKLKKRFEKLYTNIANAMNSIKKILSRLIPKMKGP